MDEATYDHEKGRIEEYESKKRRLSTINKWLTEIETGDAKPCVTLFNPNGQLVTVYDGITTQSYVHHFMDRAALGDYVVELLNNEVGRLEEALAAV